MDPNAETLTGGERIKYCLMRHWRGIIIFVTPLALSPLIFVEPLTEMRCLFTLLLMAIYWVTEVIPLCITGLIPIVLFPTMGILSSKDVCITYFKDALILFFGGIVVALTIEYCNLHKRVALAVILLVGCSPRRLHFSLMIVTMFLSMWISNAAATALMCPVIKAVLQELSSQGMTKMVDETKEIRDDEPPYPSRSVICYYMGVAYASSFGGCGTLIGTGTNLVFKGIYDGRFPEAQDVDFLNFMLFNIPHVIIHTAIIYFILEWQYMGLFRPNSPAAIEINVGKEGVAIAQDVISEKKKELGTITCHEIQVGLLFLSMIVLFITRKPGVFTGWADLMNEVAIKNSVPVIICFVLFFILPINYIFLKYCICRKPAVERTTPSLVTWKFLNAENQWSLLLLLGGGFALSEGISKSGLAILIAEVFTGLKALPPALIQLLVIILGVVATAFTANMAMCNILIPVLLEMAVLIKVHPMYLALPCTMALSLAFHLPVSTPANAIASTYANIRTKDMIIAGIGPSIVGTIGLFLVSQFWGPVVFYKYGTELPDWAHEKNETAT